LRGRESGNRGLSPIYPADDGVFSRDLIDLAMIELELSALRQAVIKAESAYGQAIRRDLNKAIERMHQCVFHAIVTGDFAEA